MTRRLDNGLLAALWTGQDSLRSDERFNIEKLKISASFGILLLLIVSWRRLDVGSHHRWMGSAQPAASVGKWNNKKM